MSSLKTEHYQLHKWEKGDIFHHDDFNENFETLDGALRVLDEVKPEAVFGSYIGDETENRQIELGFTPDVVLLMHKDGATAIGNDMYGGLAWMDHPVTYAYGSTILLALDVVEGGFQVTVKGTINSHHAYTNKQNSEYHYLAFRWK